MRKIILLILLFSLLGALGAYGWQPWYIVYSDFLWLDQNHVLTVQHVLGAADAAAALLLIDTASGAVLPINAAIDTACATDADGRIFVQASACLYSFDFTQNARPLPTGLYYQVKSGATRFEYLEWLYDNVLAYYAVDNIQAQKYIVDAGQKAVINSYQTRIFEHTDLAAGSRLVSSAYTDKSTLYFIQVSSNKNIQYAQSNAEYLRAKDYTANIFPSVFYRVMAGPYDLYKDAAAELENVKGLGFADAFLNQKNFFKINTLFYLNEQNLWLRDQNNFYPLFTDFSGITLIKITGDTVFYLKQGSLFSFNAQTGRLTQLNPVFDPAGKESGPVFRWYAKEGKLLIKEQQSGMFWEISVEPGSYAFRQIEQDTLADSDTAQTPVYTLPEIEALAEQYRDVFDPKVHFLSVAAPGGGELIVSFSSPKTGGYWCNAMSYKDENGSLRQLMPFENNF